MNEIFDFGRFCKLFAYECRNYLPRYMKGLIVFSAFIVAAWMLTLTTEETMSDRSEYICVLYSFAVFLSPFFVYKHINDRKRGYSYAMIPASMLEKLLSMVIVSVFVVPVAVYVSLTLTDAALYGLSCMGIGQFTGLVLYNPFESPFSLDILTVPVRNVILATAVSISSAIMFNAIFRKNKIIKTVLFNMAVLFLFLILVTSVVSFVSPGFWYDLSLDIESFFSAYTEEEVIALYNNLTTLWYILVIGVFLTITYFRIKRVNY